MIFLVALIVLGASGYWLLGCGLVVFMGYVCIAVCVSGSVRLLIDSFDEEVHNLDWPNDAATLAGILTVGAVLLWLFGYDPSGIWGEMAIASAFLMVCTFGGAAEVFLERSIVDGLLLTFFGSLVYGAVNGVMTIIGHIFG